MNLLLFPLGVSFIPKRARGVSTTGRKTRTLAYWTA
jgi:hypothetical protein